jgi:hypothetical protein
MKPATINGITVPQFEQRDVDFKKFDMQSKNWVNMMLLDYFKNRVCLNCKWYILNRDNKFCGKNRFQIDNPESFSCSALSEK